VTDFVQFEYKEFMIVRLYGRNYGRNKKYRTDIKAWMTLREKATGSRVVNPNVDSKGKAPVFSALSPMTMGPVSCYAEAGGKKVVSVNVEVAWQYAKVYSHIVNKKGKLVDVSDIYIKKDASGKIIGPSKEWFAWRDRAYTNEKFRFDHPQFKQNKKNVRRAFRKNSIVCFWYWDGKMLNRDQARQKIYATIYKRFLVKTLGFKRLQEAYDRWQDIAIFDEDGYDWVELAMTPQQCLQDAHSFGHGHVIAMMLQGIDPTKLVKSTGKFVPTIQAVAKNGKPPKMKRKGLSKPLPAVVIANGKQKNGKLKLDWRKYDAYEGKQKGLLKGDGKASLERLAVDILQIPANDAKKQWGEVYAPGRYATVIHILPGIRHGFGRREIGLKIFNQNPKDGLKWGPGLVRFHAEQRAQMPGLPHPRVQEVIKAGSITDAGGKVHRHLVQVWIPGNTLDGLIEKGTSQAEIMRVLDDLFGKLLIQLWSKGVVWWDFRLNNMVLTPKKQLYLIDSDVLDACADEVLLRLDKFKVRNKHSKTIIGRYQNWMLKPMLVSCLAAKGERAKRISNELRTLFEQHLHPAFLEPFPRDAKTTWDRKVWAKRATAAYKSFRAGLVELFDQHGEAQPVKNRKKSVTLSSE